MLRYSNGIPPWRLRAGGGLQTHRGHCHPEEPKATKDLWRKYPPLAGGTDKIFNCHYGVAYAKLHHI